VAEAFNTTVDNPKHGVRGRHRGDKVRDVTDAVRKSSRVGIL
jgi:hypothetical protein